MTCHRCKSELSLKPIGDGYLCSLCRHIIGYDIDLSRVAYLDTIVVEETSYKLRSPLELLAKEA